MKISTMNLISSGAYTVTLDKFIADKDVWLKKLNISQTPVIITKDGKPIAVMLKPSAFDALIDKIKE